MKIRLQTKVSKYKWCLDNYFPNEFCFIAHLTFIPTSSKNDFLTAKAEKLNSAFPQFHSSLCFKWEFQERDLCPKQGKWRVRSWICIRACWHLCYRGKAALCRLAFWFGDFLRCQQRSHLSRDSVIPTSLKSDPLTIRTISQGFSCSML